MEIPPRHGRIGHGIRADLRFTRFSQHRDFDEGIACARDAGGLPTHGRHHGSGRVQLPLHLGVTEAGDGDYGRIKSTAGIATLLAEGLGDTIRVSLTEAPEKEIPVCFSILQALGIRKTMVEYVACPSCGRTLFNLEEVLHQVRNATSHLTGLDIAVMGCIVNGPGEMADADYGYVGKGPGVIALYRNRDEIRKVPESEGVAALVQLIKDDGRWVEPD